MAPPQGFYETGWVIGTAVERPNAWSDTNTVQTAGEVLYADVLLLPNGMSKVGAYE